MSSERVVHPKPAHAAVKRGTPITVIWPVRTSAPDNWIRIGMLPCCIVGRTAGLHLADIEAMLVGRSRSRNRLAANGGGR